MEASQFKFGFLSTVTAFLFLGQLTRTSAKLIKRTEKELRRFYFLPVVTRKGELGLGNNIIPCYVLEDGTRVLSGRGMQESLKMVDTEEGKQTAGTRLARYLAQKSLKPFIISTNVMDRLTPIICYDGEKRVNGYEATVLADICEVFLEARKNIQLGERQKIIADQCETLMRGFARVGIIALVDEATGYQYKREASELQKILSAYISPELMPWEKRFPDEFYREIFRLNNWGYLTVNGINIQNRPGCIGTWTKKYIYSVLPHGVLEALLERTERNDNGRLRYKLHQHLTREQENFISPKDKNSLPC